MPIRVVKKISFQDKGAKLCVHKKYLFQHVHKTWLNPLLSESDLKILLCLTPDDFTHQRENP